MKISLLLTLVFVICLYLFQAAASSLLHERRMRTVCEISARGRRAIFSKNQTTIMELADKDDAVSIAKLQGLRNEFSVFRNKSNTECMETGSLRVSKYCFVFYLIPNTNARFCCE